MLFSPVDADDRGAPGSMPIVGVPNGKHLRWGYVNTIFRRRLSSLPVPVSNRLDIREGVWRGDVRLILLIQINPRESPSV